jgi:N-carbamoyl-L-amino-acid hydrolase
LSQRESPRINGQRLWDSLMEMAKIGATDKGGCCRLALTDEDRAARDLFLTWCREAGCSVRVDRMGNIFGRRSGANDELAPVLMGSHLDTQPTGGRFDGIYGVLAGLEVIRALDDTGTETERPIEVVNWTNEEGSRFVSPMVGSGVFAGVLDLSYGLSRQAADGATLGEELQRIGYAGDDEERDPDLHAYFELHIEQGPILEEEGYEIGVVTHAQGVRWYELTLDGFESHAGTTPMDRRRDALLGAARVVEMVNRIGLDNAPSACTTVGVVRVFPGSPNVIPGRVVLTVDNRHPEDEVLSKMDRDLRADITEIARDLGLHAELVETADYAAVTFEEDCIATVRDAAERLGYSHRDIISGAGHDACYLVRKAPTSMIFIPCVGGISHNESEDATPEWITAGANVLLHAILAKAAE